MNSGVWRRCITWVLKPGPVGGKDRCSGALLGTSICRWPLTLQATQKELVVLREATELGKGDPPARGLGGLSYLRYTVVAFRLFLTHWFDFSHVGNVGKPSGITQTSKPMWVHTLVWKWIQGLWKSFSSLKNLCMCANTLKRKKLIMGNLCEDFRYSNYFIFFQLYKYGFVFVKEGSQCMNF